MNNDFTCKICGRVFDNTISITNHIARTHKIKPKDYYDEYLKNGNEDDCVLESCNNKTFFISIKYGYRECCSLKCSNNLPHRLEFQSKLAKDIAADPKRKEDMRVTMKNTWKKDKFRKMMTTPGEDFRKEQGQKMSEKYKDPEYKLKASIAVNKAYEENTSYRENVSIGVRKALENDPTIRNRISNGIKRYYILDPKSEQTRKDQSERSKKNWKNPKYRENVITKLKIKAQDQEYIEQKRETANELAKTEKWRENVSIGTKNGWDKKPEVKKSHSERMKNGQAAYCNTFIKNPSKPQVALYKIIKEIFSTAILNHQVGRKNVDIGIPELKIAIEYDGSYYHKNVEYDNERQTEIENLGWVFLRYRDYVPTKDEIIKDMNKFLFKG